jgi:ribosomal-protein-alanine N-acetyltransferase
MNRYKRAFSMLGSYETDRLILRRIEKKDLSDLHELCSDRNVTRWLLWSEHKSREYTRGFIEAVLRGYKDLTYFEYAIVYKENMKVIGTCGFAVIDEENSSAELGYVVSPAYSGMGIATEASFVMLGIAFEELGLSRVYARYMTENKASGRVMEKLGMTYEGLQRRELFVKGEFRDIIHYSILKNEYFESDARLLYGIRSMGDKKKSFFGFWL